MEPFPCEKRRGGFAREQQGIPFGAERAEAPVAIDHGAANLALLGLNRDLRRKFDDSWPNHAALWLGCATTPSVRCTCLATCVMWRRERSWWIGSSRTC